MLWWTSHLGGRKSPICTTETKVQAVGFSAGPPFNTYWVLLRESSFSSWTCMFLLWSVVTQTHKSVFNTSEMLNKGFSNKFILFLSALTNPSSFVSFWCLVLQQLVAFWSFWLHLSVSGSAPSTPTPSFHHRQRPDSRATLPALVGGWQLLLSS